MCFFFPQFPFESQLYSGIWSQQVRNFQTDGQIEIQAHIKLDGQREKNIQGKKLYFLENGFKKLDMYINTQTGRWKDTDSCEYHTAQEDTKESTAFNVFITVLIHYLAIFFYKF